MQCREFSMMANLGESLAKTEDILSDLKEIFHKPKHNCS